MRAHKKIFTIVAILSGIFFRYYSGKKSGEEDTAVELKENNIKQH